MKTFPRHWAAALLIAAVFICIEVTWLLIGQSADLAVQEEIRRFLIGREEISEVLNLITLQHGADVVQGTHDGEHFGNRNDRSDQSLRTRVARGVSACAGCFSSRM